MPARADVPTVVDAETLLQLLHQVQMHQQPMVTETTSVEHHAQTQQPIAGAAGDHAERNPPAESSAKEGSGRSPEPHRQEDRQTNIVNSATETIPDTIQSTEQRGGQTNMDGDDSSTVDSVVVQRHTDRTDKGNDSNVGRVVKFVIVRQNAPV